MTQTEQIKRYLQSGQRITPLEALKRFGCMRLGARIWDLKRAGMAIERELIERDGKRFAEYRAT